MSDYTNPDAIVSTEWLAENLNNSNVVVLDASYHLPTVGRDAEAEFLEAHIPGAVRFDIDDIADHDDPLPHMIPSAELFAGKVGALGIDNNTHVVVYDVYGLMSAGRAWWMFRLFGHDNVSLLNGGMKKWKAEGRELASGAAATRPKSFSATLRPELVRSREQVLATIEAGNETIIDARAAGRFNGTEPEPREGMRSGHMPGSLNLPFPDLLNKEDGTLKSAKDLKAAWDSIGLDYNKPAATTCGSGVTACVLAISLFLLGKEDVAIYDGSWSEWGGRSDTPVTLD